MERKAEGAKGRFSGRLGFILSAAGAAVGLGNIYRFPYLAMKHGGSFVLIYTLLGLTLGLALMASEIAIGKKTGKSAIFAYGALDRRFSFLGYLATLAPVLIFPYYCVIGGWVLKYTAVFISGDENSLLSPGFFNSFRENTSELSIFFLIFMLISALLVLRGVSGGVELLSKLTMPPLLFLTLFITTYILLTSEGSSDAISHYLLPSVSSITPSLFVDVTGQLFYSLSIAMGTMVTFGSYMPKGVSIKSAVLSIELFDLAVAFLSGIMICASVYSYTTPDNIVGGPSLMFEALPKAISSLPYYKLIGSLLFVLILIAALTSSVALMETVVSSMIEKMRIPRSVATLLTLIFSVAIGFLSVLGYSKDFSFAPFGKSVLDIFDYLANNILMPITALIGAVLVGYIIKPRGLSGEIGLRSHGVAERVYSFLIKFFSPVCLLVVLLSAFLA